jgi:hypothetical protein
MQKGIKQGLGVLESKTDTHVNKERDGTVH